jgi:hypothetical protein
MGASAGEIAAGDDGQGYCFCRWPGIARISASGEEAVHCDPGDDGQRRGSSVVLESMTVATAIGLGLILLAVALTVIYIWRNLDVEQCPLCRRNVTAEAIDGEAMRRCVFCGACWPAK